MTTPFLLSKKNQLSLFRLRNVILTGQGKGFLIECYKFTTIQSQLTNRLVAPSRHIGFGGDIDCKY